ncbi:MAG: HlyD family efflux transporter periplasmic adaptor subunit [Ramlibacter sp.]|uniref:HlyD family efflux transporter periplasmic adaptor subunit n=1 Tax=Ramlibacter sp. TaxID=1917967 RepID=UPI00262A9518|nr:HlyD family efflux transporter periplasmic adaptor subunit [Ramlibacter sp.]MDH4375235.1 HlyD family efflux transporter periplasmic adaptor subunit [Ramlibacter sp.]
MEAASALPALRTDLALLAGSAAEDGSPTWLIHDLSRNAYFRLRLDAFRVIRHWKAGLSTDEFLKVCEADGIDLDETELKGLLQFLVGNQLVEVSEEQGLARLAAAQRRARQHWLTWLLHHYLFFRIPLWRPDAFLERTWPWVSRVTGPPLIWSVRALGLIGLLLVLQQWDVFVATFLHFWSWEGLALYGVTLAVVKSAHELGHAYAAKKYGCKVGAIGVALLVLFPVLYTDTTDAWRLRSNRQRLKIVLAGVNTEIHLAMAATFAWCFLPDGMWRSAAFFVATTSWVSSVLVNISPFMRFDGYFALSDFLHAENLQPRSFALARWQLREALFGLGEPPPEEIGPWRRRLFIAYAYATWAYRAVLFIGIALLVYHFAFKLLGIVLFLVEIIWFILLPVKNEVRQWWLRRQKIRLNRHTLVLGLLLLAVALLLALPWRSSVSLPAVLQAGDFRTVFAPEQGRVVSVAVGQRDPVKPGDLLIRLEQPEIEHTLLQSQRELSLVNEKIARQVGSTRDLQDALILSRQREELQTRIQGLADRQARLQLRAPIQGNVSRIEPLQKGQWVSQNTPLLTLRSEQGVRLIALTSTEDLYRFEDGARAVWISDLPGAPRLELKLVRIDYTALQSLPWPELATDYGGSVPTRKVQQGLRLEGAWYQIELEPLDDTQAPALQQTGRVLLEAKSESILGRYWRHALSIWIRESGF